MRITRKIAEYSTRDKDGGLKTMAMNSLMEKIKTKFNEKKITRKKIQRLGSNSAKICELIKKTGKIEE